MKRYMNAALLYAVLAMAGGRILPGVHQVERLYR